MKSAEYFRLTFRWREPKLLTIWPCAISGFLHWNRLKTNYGISFAHLYFRPNTAPRLFHILFIYSNYFYCRMKEKKKMFDSRETVFSLASAISWRKCWVVFLSLLLATFLSLRGLRAIKINSTFRIKLPDWNSYCARRVPRMNMFATNWNMFAELTLVWVWLVGGPVGTLGDGIFIQWFIVSEL